MKLKLSPHNKQVKERILLFSEEHTIAAMNQFSDVVFKCIVVVGTMTDLHCKLEEIVPNEKGFSPLLLKLNLMMILSLHFIRQQGYAVISKGLPG